MRLRSLGIRGLRNLATVELEPASHLNLLEGPNAAGKTSVLEAVHILGRGRSFRTPRLDEAVQRGERTLLITGELDSPGGGVHLGISREVGRLAIRVGGEPVRSLAELASWLPLQIINADSHGLLEQGPEQRRRFIDWGVFHVEPQFVTVWRRYQRALRQRNRALRQSGQPYWAWDSELAAAGEAFDAYRRGYLARLAEVLPGIVARTLGADDIQLEYRAGWPDGLSLIEALRDSADSDRLFGHTRCGPHRAELSVELGGVPARRMLSRGQQKTLATSLLLAQASLLIDATGRACVFLVDDLPSELDQAHQRAVMGVLQELDAQVFLTALEPDQVLWERSQNVKRFHVERGQLTAVV